MNIDYMYLLENAIEDLRNCDKEAVYRALALYGSKHTYLAVMSRKRGANERLRISAHNFGKLEDQVEFMYLWDATCERIRGGVTWLRRE